MRRLIAFLLMLSALSVAAVDRVTISITITNLPVTGNNLSFSAPATKVLIWSNTTTATFVSTNTTVNGCATNLFLQLAASAPWTPRPILFWDNTNKFSIQADCGSVIVATNSGTWATLAYDTNSCDQARVVRVPMSVERYSTTRVEMASQLITALNTYPTNYVTTNASAFTNYISVGPHPQTVLGKKQFTGLGASSVALTNGTVLSMVYSNGYLLHSSNAFLIGGYGTNLFLDGPTSTNLVNYGNAISSQGLYADGTAATSEQFGNGSTATNTASLAVGRSATARGVQSTAIGSSSEANQDYGTAVGQGAYAGYNAFAGGAEAIASGTNSFAIAPQAEAAFTDSFALGANAVAEEANQGYIGGNIYILKMSGRIQAGSYTNNLFTGTNQNAGAWADTPSLISTLANGNNVVNPGNAKVLRITSGPTAAYTINSIQGGWDGREIEIWCDNGNTVTVAHESGFDATNVNRIVTTGADVAFSTNVYLHFRYFGGTRNRWKMSASRE